MNRVPAVASVLVFALACSRPQVSAPSDKTPAPEALPEGLIAEEATPAPPKPREVDDDFGGVQPAATATPSVAAPLTWDDPPTADERGSVAPPAPTPGEIAAAARAQDMERLRRQRQERAAAVAIALAVLAALGLVLRYAWKRGAFANLFGTAWARLIVVGWAAYFFWYTGQVGLACWLGDECSSGSQGDLLWLLPMPFVLALALKWVLGGAWKATPLR
jgi:hypothetical protein